MAAVTPDKPKNRFEARKQARQARAQGNLTAMVTAAATDDVTENNLEDKGWLATAAKKAQKEAARGVAKEAPTPVRRRSRARREKPHTIGAARRRSQSDAESGGRRARSAEGRRSSVGGVPQRTTGALSGRKLAPASPRADEAGPAKAGPVTAGGQKGPGTVRRQRVRPPKGNMALQMAQAAWQQRISAQKGTDRYAPGTELLRIRATDIYTQLYRSFDLDELSLYELRKQVRDAFGWSVVKHFVLRHSLTGSNITRTLLDTVMPSLPVLESVKRKEDQTVGERKKLLQLKMDAMDAHEDTGKDEFEEMLALARGKTDAKGRLQSDDKERPRGNRKRASSATGSTGAASSEGRMRPRSGSDAGTGAARRGSAAGAGKSAPARRRSEADADAAAEAGRDGSSSKATKDKDDGSVDGSVDGSRDGSVDDNWTLKGGDLIVRGVLDMSVLPVSQHIHWLSIVQAVLFFGNFVMVCVLLALISVKPPARDTDGDGVLQVAVAHPSRRHATFTQLFIMGIMWNWVCAGAVLGLEWKNPKSWYRTWLDSNTVNRRSMQVLLALSGINVRMLEMASSCMRLPVRAHHGDYHVLDAPYSPTYRMWLDRHTISLGNVPMLLTMVLEEWLILEDDAPEINPAAVAALGFSGVCLGLDILAKGATLLFANRHTGGAAAICFLHIDEDELKGDDEEKDDDDLDDDELEEREQKQLRLEQTDQFRYENTLGEPDVYENYVLFPWLESDKMRLRWKAIRGWFLELRDRWRLVRRAGACGKCSACCHCLAACCVCRARVEKASEDMLDEEISRDPGVVGFTVVEAPRPPPGMV